MTFMKAIDMNKLMLISKLGKNTFFKKFKALTGLNPNPYINKLRLQLSVNDLIFTKKLIIDISEASGFPSLSTFNKQFKEHFGISPRQYRTQRLEQVLSTTNKGQSGIDCPYPL